MPDEHRLVELLVERAFVTATSSASEVVGFCTTVTAWPDFRRIW
jgi:hypothetical protein